MKSCRHCQRDERGPVAWPDLVGAGFSGLCLAHCLALPIVFVALPLWPGLAAWHSGMHVVFVGLIFPTTLLAMWIGFKRHGSLGPLSVLATGLLIVLTAEVLGHGAVSSIHAETALSVTGSTLLVAGHWRNWTSARRQPPCRSHS
jgi:hypothetical protein